MYALNVSYLREAIKLKGFSGIKPFLEHLGMHKNTLDRFTRGAPVLASSVEQVLAALDLPIERAIVKKQAALKLPISPLVERIHTRYPYTSLFLFGSQAKGCARRYSDFDIGIYAKGGIPLSDYLQILEEKERFEEDSPCRVDCVNLTNAKQDFIRAIAPDLRLLAGYERDRIELQEKAYGE